MPFESYQFLAAAYPGQFVHCTLDNVVQQAATTMTLAQMESLRASGISAAAVVVLDTPTSEILAEISCEIAAQGSPSATGPQLYSDFTRRPRSTGSVLKPFIYAAAFDAGICTPRTLLLDSPAAWPGYQPSNYDRAFRGPMPAADALAESRNIPALVLLGKVGVERAVGVMDSFGLNSLAHSSRPYGLTLAIGGAEATPLEVAEAYATLARGGLWRKTSLVKGEYSSAHQAMRAEPCWQALDAISATDRTLRLSPQAAALHVAWKTGTSSGHRDAWCAAVTPRRTVVVWLGNPKGEASAALIGTDAAAPLSLQLIASLDAPGPSWPEVPSPKQLPQPIRVASPSQSRLSILSPHSNQQILLNPDLSTHRQQVCLEASTSESTLWWFVDQHPIGTDSKAWWSPTPGTHRIRLVDSEGHSAEVSIDVRSP